MDDAAPARKPPSRLLLILPFVLVAAAAALLFGWWVLAKSRLEAAVDDAARAHRQAGRTLEWRGRRVGGFPFRLKMTFEDLRFASPSGWAVQAPRLEAQANAYQVTHWVLSAPGGLRLVRPAAGAVNIDARVLRASIARADRDIPRIAVEAAEVTFTPAAGAEPFAFVGAERFELHLRPAGDDQAAFVVRLRKAQPRPGGVFAFISAGRPTDLVWSSALTRVDAMRGRDWATAAGAWAEAGGRMRVLDASLTAGDVAIRTSGGELTAGRDGRLRGRLDLSLNRPLQALSALSTIGRGDPNALGAANSVAEARGAQARLPLRFEAGVMTVGPVRLGDAPRVY